MERRAVEEIMHDSGPARDGMAFFSLCFNEDKDLFLVHQISREMWHRGSSKQRRGCGE